MSIFDLRIGACGCCEPPSPGTPITICNRPGLDAIEYRVGTFPTFRRAAITLVPPMALELAIDHGLSEQPLRRWTSEQRDDYGVAFVEMWATIGDILTFYQERYANLAWLRTANDHESVRRLAQLIGYSLKPGVSAQVHLAYTLDPDTSVTIARRTRSQSVPDEGQTPQKFETASELEAHSALNRLPIYGPPQLSNQLAFDRQSATLEAASAIPNVGDRVVLFGTSTTQSQEVAIEAVDEVDGRPVISWSQPLTSSFSRMYVAKRRFRLFGNSLAPTYLVTLPTTVGTHLAWEERDVDFTLGTTTDLYLDGTVEQLDGGIDVLIDKGTDLPEGDAYVEGDTGGPVVRHVTAVQQTTHTLGPLTGPSTRLTLDTAVTGAANKLTVLELGDEVEPQTWQVPTSPIGPTDEIYLSASDELAIDPKRLLVLDDHLGRPLVVEVESVEESGPVTGTEFLKIKLKATTTRSLDAGTAFVLGNVVEANHGETIADEILGNGDQSLARQSFELKKPRVTHTLDPSAQGGAANSLQIFVDRVLWQERSGLFGADGLEHVYSTRLDSEQKMRVQFGDGANGARLTTGRANLTATYREGLGIEGNLRAGQINNAIDKPVGVKEVLNPLPSAGGAEPETLEGARENAPNTVRTFDRAVSLFDFADLAREFIGVSKAFATWVWDGEERVVHLTIGSDTGEPISDLAAVRTYLDLRRDPNRSMRLADYRPVPFQLALSVDVAADRFRDDVETAVRLAVLDYFSYEGRSFAEAVHLSDVYAVVQAVPGVTSLVIDKLHYQGVVNQIRHGYWLTPSLVHAPVFSARHNPFTGGIDAAELATIRDEHITVTMSGGLAS